MSFGLWLWGTSQVDEAIEKATSELLPSGSEDIALNLEISDQIRSKSVAPKDAMRALKKRLNHKNPNVGLLTLSLTDTCVKNGGDHFLVEIASREFMDNLVSILKTPALNHEVKSKLLRLVQNWATAFEGKPALTYVGHVYKTLKSEGFSFPPQDLSVANSAMVDTQTAPEWIDSDVCLRCRTPFTFTNRKHHCRNCGQIFDQQCSSKLLPLPHFGIQQEVRVCDGCYAKLTRPRREPIDRERDKRQLHRRHSTPHHRQARDVADEELQRAIQLSLKEAGVANVNGRSYRPGYVPAQPDDDNPASWQTSEPPLVESQSGKKVVGGDEENDPDLRAAIEASLREANAPRPSAPIAIESSPHLEAQSYLPARPESYLVSSSVDALPPLPNYDLQPLETDVILTFSQTVQDIDARGGRDISRYPAMNELYDKANGLRPKLALSLDDTDRKEQMLSDMHDKLSQAVKLYDQLLTEQLSRPRRAMSQAGSYSQWGAHARTQSLPAQHAPVPGSSASPVFVPPAQTQHRALRTMQSTSLSSQPNPASAAAHTQQYIPPPPIQSSTYAPTPPVSMSSASAPMPVLAPSAPPAQYGALATAQSPPPQPTTMTMLSFQQPVASGPGPGSESGVGSAAPYSYSTPTPAPAPVTVLLPLQAPPPPPPVQYQHYQSQVPPPPLPPQQPQLTAQPPSQPQLQPQPQPQPQPQLQSQLRHAPPPPHSQPQLQQQSQMQLQQVQAQSQPQPQIQQPQQPQQQQPSSSLVAYTPQSAFPQFPSAPTAEPQYAAQPPSAEHKEALLIDF